MEIEVVERNASRQTTWVAELARLAKIGRTRDQAEPFRLIFGKGEDLSKYVEEGGNEPIGIPSEFLESLSKDLNGLYGIRYAQNGVAKSKPYSIWYTYKSKRVWTCERTGKLSYAWDQVSCFAMHAPDNRCFFVLCLDCPDRIQKQLKDKLSTSSTTKIDPWHEMFLEAMRDLYDHAVWSMRHCIRDSERSRSALSDSDGSQPDFLHLHEIARHVIHSNECLDVAIDTIERTTKDFKRRSLQDEVEGFNFVSRILALEKDLRSIKRRSESLQERLQNEINLAFNLVAQRDSRVMVRMGERARQDNNNMRSIAVVGLVYLPGTFVSGLFGMNFFDFNDEGGQQEWKVSTKLWMYWAITLPLTVATILFWVLAFHRDALKFRRPVVRKKKKADKAGGP